MMDIIANNILGPLLGVRGSLPQKLQTLIDKCEITWAITSATKTPEDIGTLLDQLNKLCFKLREVQPGSPTYKIVKNVLDVIDKMMPIWQVKIYVVQSAQQHGGNHVQYTTHKQKYRCLVADI